MAPGQLFKGARPTRAAGWRDGLLARRPVEHDERVSSGRPCENEWVARLLYDLAALHRSPVQVGLLRDGVSVVPPLPLLFVETASVRVGDRELDLGVALATGDLPEVVRRVLSTAAQAPQTLVVRLTLRTSDPADADSDADADSESDTHDEPGQVASVSMAAAVSGSAWLQNAPRLADRVGVEVRQPGGTLLISDAWDLRHAAFQLTEHPHAGQPIASLQQSWPLSDPEPSVTVYIEGRAEDGPDFATDIVESVLEEVRQDGLQVPMIVLTLVLVWHFGTR
jgi:hypothetical protein